MGRGRFWLALGMAALGVAAMAAAACATTGPGEVGAMDHGERTLTIAYVADTHARLEPHPELFWGEDGERVEEAGGFARIAAAVKALRAERGAGNVLFLDAGDTFQGSGVAALSEGGAVVEPLNLLGLDGWLPGNWEVVYGPALLKRRAAELGHPVFAANVRDAATGERLFAPYLLREVGGVKVAVIGYTDPDVPRRQPPVYSAGLSYAGPEELPALVREVRERGAAVVVLLSHVGLAKAVALAEGLEGVDFHLSGDTHERTYRPVDTAGGPVVEAGAFGSFLGRLDLTVRDGRVVAHRWELVELTAARFPEDPAVKAAVERAVAASRERLAVEVGRTETPLLRYAVVETGLDAVLADALREAGGTEIALSNGFRFGTPIGPGPIREADLWDVYPVVTRLKTGKVTGRQLWDFWEAELENVFAADPARRFGGWLPRPSGMTVRFVAGNPRGSRVQEIRVGDEPLDPDRVYTLTACEREGEAEDTLCRIPGVREPRVLEVDAHEAVRRHLARHGPVRAVSGGRVVGADLPAVLRTQGVGR